MITDLHGHPLSGADKDAATYYEDAVAAFNIYRDDPMASLDKSIALAPAFAMAHILRAYLLGLSTEPDAMAQARRDLTTAMSLKLNDRGGRARNAQPLGEHDEIGLKTFGGVRPKLDLATELGLPGAQAFGFTCRTARTFQSSETCTELAMTSGGRRQVGPGRVKAAFRRRRVGCRRAFQQG
jgi:hypothetical protein